MNHPTSTRSVSHPAVFISILFVTLSRLTFPVVACEAQTTPEKKDAPPAAVDCPFGPSPSKPEPRRSSLGGLISGVHPTEKALNNAMQWLAKHQLSDGSWNAQLQKCPDCDGKCGNSGTLDAPMGATALCLLAFAGNGNTHLRGRQPTIVNAGIQYIIHNMKVTADEGDCTDKGGKMYSHGLCTLALCEVYGMSRDEKIRKPAQLALNFIQSAQNSKDGGWGFEPRTRSDTIVFGIQVLAAASGRSAGLQVKPEVFQKASL